VISLFVALAWVKTAAGFLTPGSLLWSAQVLKRVIPELAVPPWSEVILMVAGCGAPTRITSYTAPVQVMVKAAPCGLPEASYACIVNFAPGDAEDVASTNSRCFEVRYSTRLTDTVSEEVGFTEMVTVAGGEEVPLLLVTISWKVNTAAAPGETIGAVNVG
jgi:hypothetical protein